MRLIKFRGKNARGENVFVEFEGPLVFNGEEVTDVAQLVGYDADGNEIYEGDKLTDSFGQEWTAKIHQGGGTGVDWTPYRDLKRLRVKE